MTIQYAGREFGRKDTSHADDHAEYTAVMAALKKRDDEIQAFAAKASEEIKSHGKMHDDTKSALDKIATEGSALQQRMLDVEQKLARRGGMGGPAVKSLGQQLVETDDFKRMQNQKSGKVRLNVKSVSTITSEDSGYDNSPSVTGGAGAAIVPHRLPGVVTPAERTFTIRDLLMPGRTSSDSVEYVREVNYQSSAAPVAEGAARAQSDLTLDLVTTPVRAIGHWFAASRQVITDAPLLASYVNTRAIYGLKLAEEAQLLSGDGTGQNLSGLITQATPYNTLLNGSADTPIDTIRHAILQVRLSELRPTFCVMHPSDWHDTELTRDGEGRFLIVPNVQVGAQMQLWRLAVVETTAISVGHFLVGATMGAQVFDREDAAIEVSTEHSDYFVKKLVAISAEERLALVVQRPAAFVYGAYPS
jgi:HK97 family phage major capsid protein